VDRELVIQGRAIRPEDVVLIRDWLEVHPDSNRTRLSRELCAAWNWRNAAGRPKDMACRSLLLKLEARGQIRLPPRRTASVNALRNRQALPVEHEQEAIEDPLQRLQPVSVEPVAEGSAEALLFKALLQRHHYLGHRNCVGENLKYLARDRNGRPLACLLFGSAAWKAAARDRWIGWSAQQRMRHLGLITNNTRFLILRWVRVPHLASHLLAAVARRLSADWRQKYGHPIYLVESFVEAPRFAGTCYRAAGWLQVGLTTGRTRNDAGLKPRAPRKALYLKALSTDAQGRLAA
jgi:Druantia protein DruA